MIRLTIQMLLTFILTACLFAEGPALNNEAKEKPVFLKVPYTCSPSIQNPEFFVEKAYQHIEKKNASYNSIKNKLPFLDETIGVVCDSNDIRSYYEVSGVSTAFGKSKIKVYFKLKINGVRVKNAFQYVTFNSDGEIEGTGGSIYEFAGAKNIDTAPSISEEQAINIAINHSESLHPKAPSAYAKDVELLIAKIDDKLQLVWFMGILHGRPFSGLNSFDFYIDAKTGHVLKSESAIVY